MPFQRPSLDQLIERANTDIRSGLGVSNVIRRTFLGVIGRAIAGMSHLLHGYLAYLADQIMPDRSEGEYLLRWGKIFDIDLIEATLAEITVTVTGNAGGTIGPDDIYQTSDGLQYQPNSELTISGTGFMTVPMTAITPGTSSNLAPGATLSLLSPVANVNSDATVASIVTVAADQEDIEAYRLRVLNRLQLPPLGGSANDYITWAKEVSLVTRAWVLPLYSGAGTVAVSFVQDSLPNIIPTPTKVAQVKAYIEERKPVTALLTVFAPVPAPMALNISIKPNTQAVKDNIIQELKDLVTRDATLAGSYKGPGVTNDGSILLSKVNQAISIAVGLEDHVINSINGVAPANVVPSNGQLVTLGTITWQSLA